MTADPCSVPFDQKLRREEQFEKSYLLHPWKWVMTFRQPKLRNFEDTVVTNTRHYEALSRANESLEKVLQGLDSNITGDFLAMDIRQALHHLGEITGEITTDDLLDNIFSKFCIGK